MMAIGCRALAGADSVGAIAAFRSVMESHMPAGETVARLAESLRVDGQLERAAQAYSAAAQFLPDDPDVALGLGLALTELGLSADAAAVLEPAADKNGGRADILWSLYAVLPENAGIEERFALLHRLMELEESTQEVNARVVTAGLLMDLQEPALAYSHLAVAIDNSAVGLVIRTARFEIAACAGWQAEREDWLGSVMSAVRRYPCRPYELQYLAECLVRQVCPQELVHVVRRARSEGLSLVMSPYDEERGPGAGASPASHYLLEWVLRRLHLKVVPRWTAAP